MRKRLHLFISGRVQGVFFRQSAKDSAVALSLKGWVRNTVDGSLEIVIEGEEDKLERFISLIHTGPPLAKVHTVHVDQQEATGEFEEFEIR